MTHLYLIRHGEATTQLGKSLHDEGLTPRGMRQAECLRDRLAATGELTADVLIASTLPRAYQTAEIIAPALKLPIVPSEEIQELRVGEAEFMSMSEFRQKYGGYTIEKEPFLPVSPGGESWGQFMLRATTAIDRIVHQYEGKRVVLVCHGGIIDASFVYFLGLQSLRLPVARFDTRNTSITYWRKLYRRERESLWALARYNDDMHVRGMDEAVHINWRELPPPPYDQWESRDTRDAAQPTIPPSEVEGQKQQDATRS